MVVVVGVDGCPDGWVAAAVDLATGGLAFSVYGSFSKLVKAFEYATAIGVDIPIGLPTTYSRQADIEARKLIKPKGSSVFPAPHPEIIEITDYKLASDKSREVHGKGLMKQAFAILPKIAEVNHLLTLEMQGLIFEVHPEVSFTALNGGIPIKLKKSRSSGYEARRSLLETRSGFAPIPTKVQASKVGNGLKVHADDVLDAIVAAWTARRVYEGSALRIPELPEIGFRGLRAEIVY